MASKNSSRQGSQSPRSGHLQAQIDSTKAPTGPGSRQAAKPQTIVQPALDPASQQLTDRYVGQQVAGGSGQGAPRSPHLQAQIDQSARNTTGVFPDNRQSWSVTGVPGTGSSDGQ